MMSGLMSLRAKNGTKFELLTFSESSDNNNNNNNNNSNNDNNSNNSDNEEDEEETIHFAAPPPAVSSSHQKKRMMKRRDRDLLRPSTIIPLLGDEDEGTMCRRLLARDWCYRGAALLLAGIVVLWLLLLTVQLRQGLEGTRGALSTVEARSSELPARFHEAHVRLQLLQRNTSALWDAWQALHANLTKQQAQVAGLQEQVASLQSSVQAAPQLSSLPQDVKALQSSVAAFGSTLQDLQTGLRAVTTEHKAADKKIKDLQVTFTALSNSTAVAPINVNDPIQSIGDVVTSLVQDITQLNTSVTSLHDNVASMAQKEELQETDVKARQLHIDARLANLSSELHHPAARDVTDHVVALTTNLSALVTSVRDSVNNLSQEVNALDTTTTEHSSKLRQLAQNVSVVKGVEKKLEGSQLQLASSVSDVTQQLQSLQHIVSTLTSTTTSTTTVSPSHGGVASTEQASSASARMRRAVIGRNKQDGSDSPHDVVNRNINVNAGNTRNYIQGRPDELLSEHEQMEADNKPSSSITDNGEDRSTLTETDDEKEPFNEQRLMITESPRGL